MSIDHIHLPEFVERKADADINRCREQTMMSRNWLPNLDSPASQEKTWFIVRWNSYRLYMFAKAKWQFHTCSCCFLFDDQVLAPLCSYCGVMNLGRVVGFIFLSWSLNRLLEMLLVALTFGAGGGTFFLCCDLTLWLILHCNVAINNYHFTECTKHRDMDCLISLRTCFDWASGACTGVATLLMFSSVVLTPFWVGAARRSTSVLLCSSCTILFVAGISYMRIIIVGILQRHE